MFDNAVFLPPVVEVLQVVKPLPPVRVIVTALEGGFDPPTYVVAVMESGATMSTSPCDNPNN
jgi:hypothetical protein